MIVVTSLHGHTFVINADLIESIEETPDTMIRMTTGKKIVVKESVEDVVQKAVEFKRRCLFRITGTPTPDAAAPDSE
jgi:flagellar protein FlbD